MDKPILWSGGIVPFELDTRFSRFFPIFKPISVNFQTIFSLKLAAAQRNKINHVMNEITRQTKWPTKNVITFRKRNTNDANYIQFVRTNRLICQSNVGRNALPGSQVNKNSNHSFIKP